MLFNQINPYVRFARYLIIDKDSYFPEYIPLDARLFYTISGEGIIETEGREYKMIRGSLLIINSGISYHLITPSEKQVCYLALNFDYTYKNHNIKIPVPPAVKEDFQKEQIIEHAEFQDEVQFNNHVFLYNMIEIENNLIYIQQEYSRKILYFEEQIKNSMSNLLIEAARRCKSQILLGGDSNMDKILNYIHENYKKELTNKIIGQKFGFHPNYISNMVKLYTGLSLKQYILHIKILKAVEYLHAGNYPINEIAERCGFSSICYFSKYFKKVTGKTPTEYKINKNS